MGLFEVPEDLDIVVPVERQPLRRNRDAETPPEVVERIKLWDSHEEGNDIISIEKVIHLKYSYCNFHLNYLSSRGRTGSSDIFREGG